MEKSDAALQPGDQASQSSRSTRIGRNNRLGSTRSSWVRWILATAAIVYAILFHGGNITSRFPTSISRLFNGSKDTPTKPPNIVFILTDDQDVRLGSLDRMSVLQNRLIGEGVNFINHYGTVALCCPGRATLLRGQQAHNTNITQVGGIGGGYTKWRRTGEWKSYLPLWLKEAGYTTSYFGKFLNGYGLHNFQKVPEGWDWTDILTGPYIYNFQHVVTSENGEHPLYYVGWHQIDVLRLKALNRLETLLSDPSPRPFYLEVAPATPHVLPGGNPTVPPLRYNDSFPNLKAPRLPNWNPNQNYTDQKVAWLRGWPAMSDDVIFQADLAYQKRAEALLGVDDLVSDVIDLLEEKGVLDNTFIIYTSDNGFHIGQHRLAGGKGQAYIEDTNLPFIVRGPGIPQGFQSSIPQTHVDIAPTLLDIAGLEKKYWPPFFDGRSLLEEWRTLRIPDSEASTCSLSASSDDVEEIGDSDDGGDSNDKKDKISREVLNVAFWGGTVIPAGPYTKHERFNSYKSLRIVNSTQGYLFTRWCFSNETEMYDTTADPWELTNLLAGGVVVNETVARIRDRLAGLLLVTKSCGEGTCRDPWKVLRKHYDHEVAHNGTTNGTEPKNATFNSLSQALEPDYDSYFASLPHFGFRECLGFQVEENEGPYLPPSSSILGRQWREWLPEDAAEVGLESSVGAEGDDTVIWESNGTFVGASAGVAGSSKAGTWQQRGGTFEDLVRDTRPLTIEEVGWPVVRCDAGNEWCGMEYDDD